VCVIELQEKDKLLAISILSVILSDYAVVNQDLLEQRDSLEML